MMESFHIYVFRNEASTSYLTRFGAWRSAQDDDFQSLKRRKRRPEFGFARHFQPPLDFRACSPHLLRRIFVIAEEKKRYTEQPSKTRTKARRLSLLEQTPRIKEQGPIRTRYSKASDLPVGQPSPSSFTAFIRPGCPTFCTLGHPL